MLSNLPLNQKRCWNCGIVISEVDGHYCKDCIIDFKNGIPLKNTFQYQSAATALTEYLKKTNSI